MKKLFIAIFAIAIGTLLPRNASAQDEKITLADSFQTKLRMEFDWTLWAIPAAARDQKTKKTKPFLSNVGTTYKIGETVLVDTGGKWAIVTSPMTGKEYYFSKDSTSYWTHDTLVIIDFGFDRKKPTQLTGLTSDFYTKGEKNGRKGMLRYKSEEGDNAYNTVYTALLFTGNKFRRLNEKFNYIKQ